MSIIELLRAIGLLAPLLSKNFAHLAPIAAIIIALQMLLFCCLHFFSRDANNSPMIYWLVVFCICAFVAYGRLYLKPVA